MTSLTGIAIPIGSIISFTMSGLIFKNDGEVKREIADLMAYQNIWITVICIPFFFLIRDAPAHPPSLVATQEPERQPFCKMVGEALKCKSYVFLLIAFSLTDGTLITFSDVLSSVFSEFTASQISIIGAMTVIAGVVSSLSTAIMLKKTQKYLLTLRIVCFGVCASIFCLPFANKTGNFYLVLANAILFGICLVPIIPTSMGFAAELTFPMPAATTNGLLLMGGQVIGAIAGQSSSILANQSPLGAIILLFSLNVVSAFFTIFIVEELKREKFKQKDVEIIRLDARMSKLALLESTDKKVTVNKRVFSFLPTNKKSMADELAAIRLKYAEE